LTDVAEQLPAGESGLQAPDFALELLAELWRTYRVGSEDRLSPQCIAHRSLAV